MGGLIPLSDASRRPVRIPIITTVSRRRGGAHKLEGVAYLAHVGGFIFGAVTARFFEDRRRLALPPPAD